MVRLVDQEKGNPTYPIASEESYKDGQIIFKEGSAGNWIYVVLSGSVEISKTIEGRRFILTVLESGEVFGELGYFGAINRTATARAVGTTTLGVIDRAFLDQEFNKLSGFFRAILVSEVRRFKEMIDRACGFTTRREARAQRALSLAFKNRQSFISAYSGNISSGGLFINTSHLLNKGERFLLKLQLPGLSEPIQAKCEVVWTREQSETDRRPPGMGVKFCEMTERNSQMLGQYLQGS
ncbi:MAG: TIGR02266 family protein [Desulfobacterales bacterium]|nr:TIGR02266 family protein [Desulfobacterales bacterium]